MATTVAFSDLDSWLQSQPSNSASTPYELNITGLRQDNVRLSSDTNGTLGYILKQNSTKYVDLSDTVFPRLTPGQEVLDETFYQCTTLVNAPVLSENVKMLDRTFYQCSSLKGTPIIPSSVKNLYGAFVECTQLKSITFEKTTFNDIERYSSVFNECRNLTEFYCDSPYNLKTWLELIKSYSTSNFPNDVANCHFYLYSEITEIPIDNLSDELSALTANTPATPFVIKITELTQGVSGTTIAYVKQKLTANPTKYVDISNTVIPDPYTHTFYSIFSNCTTLVKAPPVPRLTESMEDCFLGCTNLKETPFIPDTVDWMGSAFEGCTALTKINNLPNNVNLNMHWAFKGCSSLTEVELPYPGSSTEIDLREAFSGCTSLTTLKAYRFVNTSNYAQAFKDCNNLTEFYTDTPYDLKSWLTNIRTASTNNFPVAIANCNFYLYSAPNYSEIRIEKLSDDLATLNANTVQTPFNIKTFGNNKYDIKNALTSNLTKYVNLEESGMTSITDLTKEFENCSNLIKSPKLPTITKNMDSCFKGCVNLIEFPDIPEEVENLDDAFNGCALVAATFNVPETVTTMKRTFKGCSSIELIPNVPGAVTNLTEAFSGCSSLEEIEEFDVPLSVLKTNAENCFYGCTSLTTVGVQGVDPIKEASAWHVMRLNFGQNNVSGKVYDGNKVATTIPQTDIVKGILTLPIKTDELWFPPSNLFDTDIDEIIENVIDTKRTYFNKNVLDPKRGSFVLWKDQNSNFVSNIDFGGSGSSITVYDTLQELEDDLPNHNVGDVLAVDSDYFIDKERILDDITTLAHDEILNILKEAVSVPIGTILSIPSSSVVAGYLQCNGSTFDELNYPFLYSALRTNRLPKKWNAEEWVINQEILTEETFFGKPVYSFSFYDDRTRTNSWAVCMPNGETYFPYEHNIKRIISVECSSSHNTTYRNGTVGTHIYQITNTVLDSTTQEYIPSATSQLYIYYGNQNYWSATDRVLRTIYYTKIEDDETRFRWKYIKAISGVEEEESATVVNAIQVAEEGLEQTVRDTADSIMAAAIDNYFKEYVLAEATVTPTSGTQAVNANTVFNDSLLNYRTIRFYMKRSTGSTDYIPHYEVTHEEMVNICARNTNYSLMIPGYASEYRQMTFNAGGTVCTAVAGSECCYKVIGIGKLN